MTDNKEKKDGTYGYILRHNQYGYTRLFVETIEEAKFALKVFGEEWHIERYFQPKFKYEHIPLGSVMGYAV